MKTGLFILLLLTACTLYGQLFREQHYVGSGTKGVPHVWLHLYADSTFKMTIDYENCLIPTPCTGGYRYEYDSLILAVKFADHETIKLKRNSNLLVPSIALQKITGSFTLKLQQDYTP